MKSILKLFHSILIQAPSNSRKSSIFKQTIPYGFIFGPEVLGNYTDQELLTYFPLIEKEIGLTKEQMNETFHKSWKKVRDADISELILEQLIHYITTYGYEDLGIYEKETVYIPVEKLKIPKSDMNKIKIVVIHGLTKEQIQKKIWDLITSGIALKTETITAIIEAIEFIHFMDFDINEVKNKEVRCILCDKLGKIPKNPVEFLRFLIYKVSKKTLLIKDPETIEQIKLQGGLKSIIQKIFTQYEQQFTLVPLATIFYRFKPLFLAFKNPFELNHTINRIRKLAKKHHQPMKEAYLNTVTAKLKQGDIDENQFNHELLKVNVFRRIRLAYALNFRLTNCDAILYKIRNGKSWATEFDNPATNHERIRKYLDLVLQNIAEVLSKHVKDKTIFLDNKWAFGLPSSEKTFSGNIPFGSSICLSTNLIIGVNWNNINNNRIDLDLSLLGDTKYGWDDHYRRNQGVEDILFSGDMTDAKDGATEAFYIQKQDVNNFLLLLNYFNLEKGMSVPFKLFASREEGIEFHHNYTVNPNKVEMIIPSIIDKKQMMLGMILLQKDRTKLILGETALGNSRTSKDKEYIHQTRRYIIAYFSNPIVLNDLLLKAGAKFMKKKNQADIDLSIEDLQKDTILKLFS